MHVVASRPTFLSSATIPAALLEAQRAEFTAKVGAPVPTAWLSCSRHPQAAQMKKPPSVEAQVVAGQLGKWYGEVCLLNQSYLLNDASSVLVSCGTLGLTVSCLLTFPHQDAIGEVSSRTGTKLSVRGFARLQAGEGVQKDTGDFAAEVASMAGV